MRLLFVIDPLERLSLAGDTTLALMQEARRRGHEVLSCEPEDLGTEHGDPVAIARPAAIDLDATPWATLGAPRTVALADCGAVLMRKDPPFDRAYLLATQILELARGRTLLVNDPRGLRECNEKLFALRFSDLMPPTIVTRDPARVRAFVRAQGGRAVIKPLSGAGGAGVFVLAEGDRNLPGLIEAATGAGRTWAMVQRYLPQVRAGDKRILLLGGRPLAALLRVPRADDARANLHVGGTPVAAGLSARDRAICDRVGPALAALGLHFVGLDVIGRHLTEINVTSPTGIREINRLEGLRLETTIVRWLERAKSPRPTRRPRAATAPPRSR